MQISLSRKMKVSMGNYENYEFSAHVTISTDDLGLTQDEVAEDRDAAFDDLQAEANKRLDQLLAADIEAARDVSIDRGSFVFRSQPEPAAEKPRSRSQRGTSRAR